MPGSGEGLRRARKTDHSEGYRGLEIHATTSPARTRQQPAWAHMQLTDRTPVAKVPLTGLSSGTLEKQAIVDVTSPNVLATGLDGLIWVAFGSGVCDVGYLSPDNGWSLETVAQAGVFAQGLTAGLDGSIWVSSSVSGTVQQILRPAYKPIGLASSAGPGPGEMTLAWQPPVIDGGTPVISYTATVSQGTYTKTITTNDTSCVFDGLSLGSGPTYFTVTATNFAGESKTAALQIDAYGNPIP